MNFDRIGLQQDTPEWKLWRCGGIGASDAPSIMGEDPWKSAAALQQEKLRPTSHDFQNAAMARGKRLEPVARQAYNVFRGIGVEPLCVQSRTYPWMRASLDGIDEDERIVVEIKCGESCYKKTARWRSVPDCYYGQLQHILAVIEYEAIDFWCYYPGNRPICLTVPRDERYINILVTKEREFWEFVGPAVSERLKALQTSSMSRP